VRVLIDYRPALRERTGVGEYTHELVRALLEVFPPDGSEPPLDVTLFSSSWKDRLVRAPELARARTVDRRIPVRALNFAWHRLDWPPAETLARGSFDIAHSLHPLLLPSRRAAQVVSIYDLDFLKHPERTRAEVRRDYPALAREHAHRADAIVTISHYTAHEIERHLEVPRDRIVVCPPGAPAWKARSAPPDKGHILFIGTLEPRKNIGGLLDAYERFLSTHGFQPNIPDLVLAGKTTPQAAPWLERIALPPLIGRVRHIGYVNAAERRMVYERARVLMLPSFDEGFGIPAVEAMTVGVPVIASNRGALPEVIGDAGPLLDPDDIEGLANALGRMIDDRAYAAASAAKGLAHVRRFNWHETARRVYDAYALAIQRRSR
jgi:glycosyltransferase involved in cell wall biosynthesis